MLVRASLTNSALRLCIIGTTLCSTLTLGYSQSPSLQVHQLTTQSGTLSYSRLIDWATGNPVSQGATLQWGRLEAYNDQLNTLVSGAATLTVQAGSTRPAIAFSVGEARQPNDFVKMPPGEGNGHRGATQNFRSGVVYLPSTNTVICDGQPVPRYRIEAFAQDNSATDYAYSAVDFEIQSAPIPTITGYAPFLRLEQPNNAINLLSANLHQVNALDGICTIRWGNGVSVVGNRSSIFFVTLFDSLAAPYRDVAATAVELTITFPTANPTTYRRSASAVWEAAALDGSGGGSGVRPLTVGDSLVFDPRQYLFQQIRLRYRAGLSLLTEARCVTPTCEVDRCVGPGSFSEALDQEIIIEIVPEPSSLLILASSVGLWAWRSQRKRKWSELASERVK